MAEVMALYEDRVGDVLRTVSESSASAGPPTESKIQELKRQFQQSEPGMRQRMDRPNPTGRMF
jgi:hypothetical protein